MTACGSTANFASWAGLCLGNNESAGKRKSGKTRNGNRWVRRLLCEMANTARRTECLVVRWGSGRSVMALAHKLMRMIFAMFSKKVPYQDKAVDYEELLVKRKPPR